MSDTDADDSANEIELHNKNAERESLESKARALGWSPKEEFKGNPANWRDADEYLRRGEEILPIVTQNNRMLLQRVGTLESQLKEQNEVLVELRDFSRTADERAYKRAREEVQAEIRTASANADPQATDRALAKLEALDSERPLAAPAKTNGNGTAAVHPDVAQWVRENEWFERDKKLKAFATELHGELLIEKPGLSLRENLDEVTREIKARFPEKFGNARRDAAGMVSTPGGLAPKKRGNGKAYEDLPPDAKKACDRFVKIIPGYTRDEYLKTYDWTGDQA